MLTNSTVRTSELDYTVAALTNKKCINSMTYMITEINDITLLACVVEYDTLLLCDICKYMLTVLFTEL